MTETSTLTTTRDRLLTAAEEDLRSELQRLQDEAAVLNDEDADMSVMDLVDRASAVVGAQALARRQATVMERLDEVRDAIARAADGTLGRCDECGEEIDGERLRAVPTTRSCRRDAGCG